MKKDLFGKLTAFRSIVLFFLVMLTGLVANADGTAGKTTPYVYIQKPGYGGDGEPATYLNDTKFIEPSIVIYESQKVKTMVTNRFYISYYLTKGNADGMDSGVACDEKVEKGKTYSVDPVTGTRVNTRYGDVETGNTAGVVYVHVKATPTDRYTEIFNEGESSYRITLNKVKADKPELVIPDFVTDETYKNVWHAATGTIISLPNFKINYTTTNTKDDSKMVLDVTQRYKISAEVADEASKQLVEVVDNYSYNSLEGDGTTKLTAQVIKVKDTEGTAKINFTFEPINKEAYYPIEGLSYELQIVDGKVTPKLVFPAKSDLVYTGMQNIPIQRPTVYDQYGNNITPSVSWKDGSKPLWIAWSAAPLEEGKTMHTPQDYQTCTMKENGGQTLPDNMISFNSDKPVNTCSVVTTWAPDINAGDLVFQKGVARNEFKPCNQSSRDNAVLTSKLAKFTTKIYCQVYPSKWDDAANKKYNASEESYDLTIKPRPVKLELSPSPKEVHITKGAKMNWQNRFEVTGVHTCEINDTKFNRNKDEQYVLRHNSEANDFGCEYTIKFKTGEAEIENYPYEDEQHHITVDDKGNKVDKNTYEGETWEVYCSTKAHGTDSNWTLSFLKEGPVTLTYAMYPYNIGYYEDGEGEALVNEVFNVEDKITPRVKVTPDPIIIYTSDKEFPTQPTITITDDFGNDIKEHYNLVFDEEELKKAGIGVDSNGDFYIINGGPYKGDYPEISVKAIAKDPEHYKDGETTFRIIVKEIGESVRFSWRVVNQNGQNIGPGNDDGIKTGDNVHGKLVFTSAGLVSGGYTIDAIPGLSVTLGNLAKQITDGETKADDGTVADKTTDEDPWIATDPGEADGNKVIVYGAPVELDEKGIPTDGTYYILQPKTNGYLTLDAKFKAGNSIVLTDKAGNEKQSIEMKTDAKKPVQFRYPIYGGTTYYLYNAGDATTYEPLKVHGISFEPGFINQRNDMEPVKNATAYANGFVGALPSLTSGKVADDNVTFAITGNIIDSKEDIKDYAEVDNKYGLVTTKTKGTAKKFAIGNKTIDNFGSLGLLEDHLKIYAEVKSAYAKGGDKVKKVPAYNLYIGDIPTYVMKNGYTPNVLEKISTTNYPTHIRAFFGGWENDTDKPYYKNNKFEGENLEMIVDSWKTSKMDSVGSNERVIDNFSYASFGTQNASSETVNTKFEYKADDEDQTYNVPCRGTYVQFEPNESGTIAVYIIQNGMVAYDGDPEHATKSGMNKLKVNPVFITDETGTPVKLTKWTHSIEGENTDAYTEAVVRCSYKQMVDDCNGIDAKSESIAKELLTKVGYITEDGVKPKINKGDKQVVYDIATTLDPTAVPGSLGYSVITKAYTRYSFNVKAGKSYFLFMNGSKLGNDGFAFMPTDWKAGREEPELQTVTLDEKGTAEGSKDEFLGKEDTFDKYDKTVNVKLYHSFNANQWTALSLPFSVNDSQIRKVFGDDAWVISLDQIADKATVNNVEYQNVAQFLQHNYHWIVAGRPYFIRPGKDFNQVLDDNNRQYVMLDSVTFERNAYTDANKYDTGSGYIQAKTLTQHNKEVFNFKAIYAPTTISAGDYFIGSTTGGEAKLYRATKDTNLSGYRAYIDNKGKANGARIGSFGFGDFDEDGNKGTTGIDEVYEFYDNGMGKKLAGKKGVFSVDGVKMADSAADIDKLPAGVYIVNGQTVVK